MVKKGDTHSRGQKKGNKKQQQAVAPEPPPKKKVFILRKPVFEVKQSVLYEGGNEALGLATKKLLKKDANTKSKAISEIITILDELHTSDTSTIKDFMPFFADTLEKLALDEHVPVRLGLGTILRRIIIRDKQALATHMKDMIGPWMQLLCDPSSDIAAEFTACLEEAFPIKRRPVVLVHLSSSLLRYILKFVSMTPEEMRPLLDLSTSSDLEERYYHIVSSNLTAIAKLMNYLNTEQNSKLLEGVTNTDELLAEMSSISYTDLFHENAVFQHATSNNLLLRNAIVFVLETLVESVSSLAHDCMNHIRTVITHQLRLADRSTFINTLKMTVTCITKVPLLFENTPFLTSTMSLFLVMLERFGDDCVEYFLPLVGNISAVHLSCHVIAVAVSRAEEGNTEENEGNDEETEGDISLFDMVVRALERILKVSTTEGEGRQSPPSLNEVNIAQLLQAVVFLLLRKPPTSTIEVTVVNQDRVVRLLKIVQTSIMALLLMSQSKDQVQSQEKAEMLTLIGKSLALLHRATMQSSCNMSTSRWNELLWQPFTDNLLAFDEEKDGENVKKIKQFVAFLTVAVNENGQMLTDHLTSSNGLGLTVAMIIRFLSALHLREALEMIEVLFKPFKIRSLVEELFQELIEHHSHEFIKDVAILEKVFHISPLCHQQKQKGDQFFMKQEYLLMMLHSGSIRILTLLLHHLHLTKSTIAAEDSQILALIERVAMTILVNSNCVEEAYASSILTSTAEEKVSFLLEVTSFDQAIKTRLLSTVVSLWKHNILKRNTDIEVWFLLSMLLFEWKEVDSYSSGSNKRTSEITQLLLHDEEMKFKESLLQLWFNHDYIHSTASNTIVISSWNDIQTRLFPLLSSEFVSSWHEDLKVKITVKTDYLMHTDQQVTEAMVEEVANDILRYHHSFSAQERHQDRLSLRYLTSECWFDLQFTSYATSTCLMLFQALLQKDANYINEILISDTSFFIAVYNIVLMSASNDHLQHVSCSLLLSVLDAKVEVITVSKVVLFVLQGMALTQQQEMKKMINVEVGQRVLQHINRLSSSPMSVANGSGNVKKDDKNEDKVIR